MVDVCYFENVRVFKYDKFDIFFIFNIYVCIIFLDLYLKCIDIIDV